MYSKQLKFRGYYNITFGPKIRCSTSADQCMPSSFHLYVRESSELFRKLDFSVNSPITDNQDQGSFHVATSSIVSYFLFHIVPPTHIFDISSYQLNPRGDLRKRGVIISLFYLTYATFMLSTLLIFLLTSRDQRLQNYFLHLL